MRTREEIMDVANSAQDEDDSRETATANNTGLILEVLLDIRDLLANPPLEHYCNDLCRDTKHGLQEPK